MKKIVFSICFVALFSLFTGCVTTGFSDFYTPWVDDNYFPEEETPIIISTSDISSKFREISSDWYWCIGNSGFNGAELETSEVTQALTHLCKEKRARIALWTREYTDTRNGIYSIPYTNYHSYTDSFGRVRSYTTTSYSTQSYSVARYDFISYLFVSIPDEYKVLYTPGFSVCDLDQQDRDRYKQNTGCMINVVYKDTVAYYANLIHGDIITKINGNAVLSADDFIEIRKNANLGDVWNMTIVRNGYEKQISLKFWLY